MKRHILISWFACTFGISILAHAQAVPTASKAGALQIGAGATLVAPDYGTKYDEGPTIYATYDFTRHIGVEADVHYASIITPADIGEDTYLIGPRYVIRRGRFAPYAKVIFGIGQINLQFDYAPHSKTSHFAYAGGAGLDFRAASHLNVRIFDFEYQQWQFQPHGLSPAVFTIGAAYSF